MTIHHLKRSRCAGFILPVIAFSLLSGIAPAQEAQWRGEQREGHYPSRDLLREWPGEGPEFLAGTEGVGRGFFTRHGGVVLMDGYIYGSNWTDNSRGEWCCIEWETNWAHPSIWDGHLVVRHGDALMIYRVTSNP